MVAKKMKGVALIITGDKDKDKRKELQKKYFNNVYGKSGGKKC